MQLLSVKEPLCLCRVCVCVFPSPPLEATTYFLSVYDLIHWWLYEPSVINGGISVFLPAGPRLSIGDNYSRGWL